MKAIAVYTETGTTARLVSKYRPQTRIFAFARRPAINNRLNLYWGVQPLACERVRTAEEMVRHAEQALAGLRVAQPGDVLGIISGTRGTTGSTNLMRLHVIGEKRPIRDRRGPRRPGLLPARREKSEGR